jgi:AcrR family transcriptional regulator
LHSLPEKAPDIRAIAKESVRVEIAEIAWTLFAEHGFDDVTVNEVAERAGISRATFFRYFKSKEEAVFLALDAMGAEIARALAARPAGEDAWTALRCACDAALPNYSSNPSRSLARLRLTLDTPSVRAHQLERQSHWRVMIGEALAERLGLPAGDLCVEAMAGAAIGALDAATSRWAEQDGKGDLPALIDEAFGAIGGPFPKLR